jgi:hypothetical protein
VLQTGVEITVRNTKNEVKISKMARNHSIKNKKRVQQTSLERGFFKESSA